MGAKTLKAERFLGLTQQPLYQQEPGKLKVCKNFRVTPDGLLEAGGGHEKFIPTGGSAVAPISGGFYTGAHEHAAPVGWVMTFDGAATYSNNLALQAYVNYFAGTAVGNRIYFIAPHKFSRIQLLIGTAGTGGYTILWKYLDTGGAAQTLTGVTEDFKTTGTRNLAFSWPATWGLNAVNNVYGYVIYAEVATAVLGTIPQQKDQRIYVDWQGMKELYLGSSDSAAATNNGTVKRHGLTGSTSVSTTITSSLTSAGDPRIRFSSWRGYLYWLNGYEQKRYNLDSVADMGFTTPTGALTTALTAGTGLTGLFRYAITYGYGAAGELGESSFLYQTDADRTPANQQVTITFSGLTSVPSKGTADIIYVYRSIDLSAVTLTSSYGAFPFYRIATVTRDATGAFPATYVDSVMAIPVPVKTMNPLTNLPPSACQFLAVHRSRMFMARNNQYPGRVWWSKNFEPESFNQDEDYADFTRQSGGVVTGMIEFADQIIVFTEDAMYGIANVDQDPPNVYIVTAGVGCIAPDSIRSGYGFLCWVARGGVYVWDGEAAPRRVSDDITQSLVNLSLEAHGGTRGIIYDRLYEATFISPANAVLAMERYRYDLSTDTWSTKALATSDVNLAGLVTFTCPVGHEDAGGRHPLYGKVQATGSLFHVFVGDWKTVDDGSAITYQADIHFGPSDNQVIAPLRVAAVYRNQAPSGWATPVSLGYSTGAFIGDTPALGSVFTDGATDYTVALAQNTAAVAYSGDLVVSFSATSQSGGTAKRQHLIAVFLDGNVMPMPNRTT